MTVGGPGKHWEASRRILQTGPSAPIENDGLATPPRDELHYNTAAWGKTEKIGKDELILHRNTGLTLVALLCLFGAGCVDYDNLPKKEEKFTLPFDGQRVGIAVPEGFDFPASWRGSLTEWSAQTGAALSLSEYDSSDSRVVEAQFSPSSTETLIVFPLEDLGTLIDQGVIAEIPRSLQSANAINWTDLMPGLRDGVASPGKRPGVVPLSCPVLVCYYRQDLLDRANLQPPETWDDYQRLLDTLAEWAPGLTAVEPLGPEFLATAFLSRAVSLAKHPGHYSVFFDLETAAPQIDGPAFVRSLEKARNAWSRLAPDSRSLSPEECRRRVLRGEAAIAIAMEPPGAETSDSVYASLRAKEISVGVCRLPGSLELYNSTRKAWEPARDQKVNHVTLVGFSGFGVSASSRRDEGEVLAAWHAVSQIGSRGFASGFPAGTTGICRESQLADVMSVLRSGLEGGEAGLYLDAVSASLRDSQVVSELLVPRRREFREKLTSALTSVLDDGVAPEAALAAAAKEWQAIIDDIGLSRMKSAHRAGLGLNPSSGL